MSYDYKCILIFFIVRVFKEYITLSNNNSTDSLIVCKKEL